MSQNPNDKIREAILSLLNSVHQNSGGMSGTAIGVRKIEQELKKKGFSRSEVASNLDYLIQTEWVIKQVRQYPLNRGGVTLTAEKVTYKISEKGINHFQGTSKFQKVHNNFSDGNIINNKGIMIIGDNNYIYTQHADLFRHLDIFDAELQKTDKFSSEEKLEHHADIETIKNQLSKLKPNQKIVEIAWKGVEAAAAVGGAIGLYQKISQLIAPLLV